MRGRLTESKVLTASAARKCLSERIDGNTGIREFQKLRIGKIVSAVATGDAVSDDRLNATAVDAVVGHIAGEYRGVGAVAAIDDVVADPAGNVIITVTAADDIVVTEGAEESVLMLGRVELDAADIEIERAG